jgi:hypothetical protein
LVNALKTNYHNWFAFDDADTMAMESILTAMDESDLTGLGFNIYRAGEAPVRGEPIVYFWRNGVREMWQLPDGQFGRDLYESITGLNDIGVGVFAKTFGLPAAALRLGVTTDPTFQVTNFIRGELTAWALDTYYKPLWSFAKGIKSAVLADELKYAYAAEGGIMGGINANSLAAKRAQKDIKRMASNGISINRMTIKGFLELTEISESGMRLGLFKETYDKAIARGLGHQDAMVEAVFTARDITDYGRHGAWMTGASRVITFLNAHAQGADKFTRVLGKGGIGAYQKALELTHKDQEGMRMTARERHDLKAARHLMVAMTGFAAVSIALMELWGDDEEFQQIGEYMRATHWMVRSPIDGTWVAIPKPHQEAIIANLAERAWEAWKYDDPEAWARGRRMVIDQFLLPPYFPVILKPGYEHATNRSMYNDMPIIPREKRRKEPYEQAHPWTSSVSKWLANTAIGKELELSPILLDHYFTSWTGTVGRSILGVTNIADPKAPAQGVDDMYFWRRFFRDYTRGSRAQQEFYKRMSDEGGTFDRKWQTWRGHVKEDNNEKAIPYLKAMSDDEAAFTMSLFRGFEKSDMTERMHHPMHRAVRVAKGTNTTEGLNGLRRSIRDADTSTFSPDQKRKLDDLISRRVVAEFENAMIASQLEGFAKRPMFNLENNMEKIRKVSANVADKIMDVEDTVKNNQGRIILADQSYEDFPYWKKMWLEDRDRLIELVENDPEYDIDGEIGNVFDAMTGEGW